MTFDSDAPRLMNRSAFEEAPAYQALGMRLDRLGPSSYRVLLTEPEKFAQETGVVHGGILTTVADTAAVYAILPTLSPLSEIACATLSMSFLRPGLPDGSELIGTSRVLKAGRRITLCESDVHQDGRLLARGTFTFIVDRRKSRSPEGG